MVLFQNAAVEGADRPRHAVPHLRIFGIAIVLSLGCVSWLHGLNAAGLGSGYRWSGGIFHILRDGLFALPLTLGVLLADTALAGRQPSLPTMPSVVARAVLIGLGFALLLGAMAPLHQYLDRAIDGAPKHLFHGQARSAGVLSSVRLVHTLKQALADALFAYAAAVPLILLWLARRSGSRISLARTRLARFGTIGVVAVAVFGISSTGLVLGSRLSGRDRHDLSEHAASVSSVTIGPPFKAGDFNVSVDSAKWVRQPREAPLYPRRSAPDPALDRVYLQVRLKNLTGSEQRIGRAEFQMRSAVGGIWSPLADDFSQILVGPEETLTTWFIFELSPAAARLEFAWAAAPTQARTRIGDDPVGGIFGALCRALSIAWPKD